MIQLSRQRPILTRSYIIQTRKNKTKKINTKIVCLDWVGVCIPGRNGNILAFGSLQPASSGYASIKDVYTQNDVKTKELL